MGHFVRGKHRWQSNAHRYSDVNQQKSLNEADLLAATETTLYQLPEALAASMSVAEAPSAMAPNSPYKAPAQDFLEFEGNTIFAPPPAPTYRYAISLKSGRLRLWLEDCNSKKQWCSAELELESYVDSSNTIPDATASDYVRCFHELLSRVKHDVSNISSTFQRLADEVFRLELSVRIQVLSRSSVATYSFKLEPVSVERIDVLEARMRDLQDEVDVLRQEKEAISSHYVTVQKLEEGLTKLRQDFDGRNAVISDVNGELKAMRLACQSPEVVAVQATTKVGDLICWKSAAADLGLNVTGVDGFDGVVRVLNSGVYHVALVVNHQAIGPNLGIQLVKGSECILKAYCGFSQRTFGSCSMASTVRLETTDLLTVKCPANLAGTSYLTLTRLGV